MTQDLLLLIARIVIPPLAFWAGLAVGRRTKRRVAARAPRVPDVNLMTNDELAAALAARHEGCHDHVLVDAGKLVSIHDASGGCGEAMQALVKHRIGEALKSGVPLEEALRKTLGSNVVKVDVVDAQPLRRPRGPHSVN